MKEFSISKYFHFDVFQFQYIFLYKYFEKQNRNSVGSETPGHEKIQKLAESQGSKCYSFGFKRVIDDKKKNLRNANYKNRSFRNHTTYKIEGTLRNRDLKKNANQ